MRLLLVILLGLVGCDAAVDDLIAIKRTKEKCKAFKEEYDKVKPAKDTEMIRRRIENCKDNGAWD